MSYVDRTGMIGEPITSTFINSDGTVIAHIDDGDPRVYMVLDPSSWDGASKSGTIVVGFEDPTLTYNPGDKYKYYNPLYDTNFNDQYMLPAELIDYTKDVNKPKQNHDWNYIANGVNGTMISRFTDILFRDLFAPGNNETVNNISEAGFIYIGRFKLIKSVFHREIKPSILSKAGQDYSKHVGNNPNINVKNGKIVLEGTGPYKGKSYETNLPASDFLE